MVKSSKATCPERAQDIGAKLLVPQTVRLVPHFFGRDAKRTCMLKSGGNGGPNRPSLATKTTKVSENF